MTVIQQRGTPPPQLSGAQPCSEREVRVRGCGTSERVDSGTSHLASDGTSDRTSGLTSSPQPQFDRLTYRDPSHEALPHVVKFSGGRSSAAMTFLLAEQGLLKPQRGDVVLFANTSAEHPGTYDFAAECTRRLEQEFSLPVFWYEFCTVEDAFRGVYRRRRSYKLVKPVPIEEDPDGYRSNGEVFEEMLSFQGMLPNPHSRSCTAKLKLHPGHALLAEWFAKTVGPAHDGHHREEPYIDLEDSAATYRKNGGSASAETYIKQKQFMMEIPTSRPQQRWQDFTNAPIYYQKTKSAGSASQPANFLPKPPQNKVRLFGMSPKHFVTLLGLRADEPRRVERVLSRTLFAEGAGSAKCQVSNQPPGEHPYFPLYDFAVTSGDVKAYWHAQDFDLDIPEWAGNCVFCFMKGTQTIRDAGQAADERRVPDSPSDISWWRDIERKYRREIPSIRGEGISKFGFFGVSGPSFAQLAAMNAPKATRYSSGTPACDCTD